MGRARLTDSQNGFAGFNPDSLYEPSEPEEFGAVTNMRVVRNFEMAKRPGFKQAVSISGQNGVNFITSWNPADGAQAGTPVVLWASPNSGDGKLRWATFDKSTGLLAATAVASPTNVAAGPAAHFRDGTAECLYINGGSGNHLSKWNGATLTSGVATSAATDLKSLWVSNQRLFALVGTDQTLYWSGLNNGDTLGDTSNGGGSATIRTYAGGFLRYGFALGNSSVLLHSRGISQFTGRTFDDIAIQAGTEGVTPEITPLPGAQLQTKPFVVVGETAYLATYQGLMLMTAGGGVQTYQDASGRVDPIRQAVGTAYYVFCGGVMENARRNEIWFWLNIQTTSAATPVNQMYIYNTKLHRFTGRYTFSDSHIGNTAMAQVLTNDYPIPQPQCLICYNTTDICAFDFANSTLEVFQDLSSNYTSSVQCRRMFTNQPQSTKSWRGVYVQMGAGGQAAAAVGDATGATISYTSPLGGTVADSTSLKALETNQIQLSGQGQYVDITITDGGAVSTDWSVQRLDASGFDMGMRAS